MSHTNTSTYLPAQPPGGEALDSARTLALLQATIEASTDGLFVLDTHGRISIYNRRFLDLWNIPGHTIDQTRPGMPPEVLARISDPQAFLAAAAKHAEHPDQNGFDTFSFTDGRLIENVSYPLWLDGAIAGRVFILRDVTERVRAEQALRESEARYRTLIDRLLDGIFAIEDGRFTLVNSALAQLLGYSIEEMIGQPFAQFVAPEDRQTVADHYRQRLAGSSAPEEYEARLLRKDGQARIETLIAVRVFDAGTRHTTLGTVKDISERKQAEREREQHHAALIAAQEAALLELSTPLIPISNEVVIMPLIGAMDSRRAQQVLETLLEGVAGSGASIAILDITGVALVDTQVANALIRAAQAVKLLGAQVVLTGIRPEIAQTLVGLSVDLGGIVTCSTLQSGIAFALERRAIDIRRTL
jgi:PAS domain S-box-containing protein